ncbi:adenylate/guanylate cyclase domain-containing protein [Treponema sp.]
MKKSSVSKMLLRISFLVYSLFILIWLGLSFFIQSEQYIDALRLPFVPLPLAPIQNRLPVKIESILLGILVYAIPLISLYKIASLFLEKRLLALAGVDRFFAAFLLFLQTSLVVFIHLLHLVRNAKDIAYFYLFSSFTYVVFFVSIAFNIFSIVLMVKRMNRKNVFYQEYAKTRSDSERKNILKDLIVRQGIQRRLLFSFVPLILAVILILSFILLRSFSATIQESIIQNGKLLAERTANLIKANPADTIAVEDYLLIEARKNATAPIPFKSISYYLRAKKAGDFTIAASTNPSLSGTTMPLSIEAFTESEYEYNQASKIYNFRAPIRLGKSFLGFVQAEYERDIIFEPYFRSQVQVIMIASLFVYFSVVIIYLIGRNIVFPILFLGLGVASLSKTLSSMIRGETRVSAELLTYTDRVTTKDEIKSLSKEVGTMATVLRGIVPYISASTLKNAERSGPTTENRDLCFLFTDIRGFTTLCEGMKPEEVVKLLNHYLDLQASLIIANGGDIDKFVGDEVMAVFEGPGKEQRACKAGMEIRAAMAKEKEIALAAKKNVVSIGIGINTGEVVFGSVGAKDRMDFTSIGDTVNLAARLEGANKAYGTKTLITEAVFLLVQDEYLCREIDFMTVKGKSKPVRIFELLQKRSDTSAALGALADSFKTALDLYRAQKWEKAEKAFTELVGKYHDEASETYLERIALFKVKPPAKDWDGVFALSVK